MGNSALSGLRIGAVPYLNAEPLVWALPDSPRRAIPATLESWLSEGVVDLATLPIGAALRHPEWKVLTSCGIACEGPVRTVLLLHAGEFSKVRAIAADPASVSSNLLARCLLKTLAGSDPEIRSDAPSRVVIGDAAFAHSAAEGTDLGGRWMETEHLPFLFAGWCASGKLAADPGRLAAVNSELLEILSKGEEAIDQIAKHQNTVAEEMAQEYLRKNVRYRLGDLHKAGAERYAQQAFALHHGSGRVSWAS